MLQMVSQFYVYLHLSEQVLSSWQGFFKLSILPGDDLYRTKQVDMPIFALWHVYHSVIASILHLKEGNTYGAKDHMPCHYPWSRL